MVRCGRKYLTILGSLVALLMISVLVQNAFSGMYRWVDKDGRVQYSDSPPFGEDSSRVKTLPVYESDVDRSAPPAKPSTESPEEDVKKEVVVPESPPPVRGAGVELYTTSWCPWCRKAKAFLKSKGVAFVEYDIEKDKAAARRKEQLDRKSGVPFAVINGKKIHGYSEKAYLNALGL